MILGLDRYITVACSVARFTVAFFTSDTLRIAVSTDAVQAEQDIPLMPTIVVSSKDVLGRDIVLIN